MFSYQAGSATSLLLGGGGSSLLGGLLEGGLSLNTSVEVEAGARVTNATNGLLLLASLDHSAGDRTVNLVLLAEGAAGDAEDLGDLRLNLGPALLIQKDVVVELILYLDLSP